jgi:hypothetical protein
MKIDRSESSDSQQSRIWTFWINSKKLQDDDLREIENFEFYAFFSSFRSVKEITLL